MDNRSFALLRVSITLTAVVLATAVTWWLWVHYELAPWTRDGRVRADVVSVAADVSGLVAEVTVVDNQVVHKGELLFEIDAARYKIALRQALAVLARGRIALAQAKREAGRDESLEGVVSVEAREQSRMRLNEAEASIALAVAEVAAARLNLERTRVVAHVNGVVTNLELRPGDYLSAGAEGLALTDTDSLHVDGYFEETKLPRLHVGDRVSVRLMGETRLLYGHIHSIAAAIDDRERVPTGNRVASVNPTFSWVRLAQRVPVRVELDEPLPEEMRLIAGRTATVVDLSFGVGH